MDHGTLQRRSMSRPAPPPPYAPAAPQLPAALVWVPAPVPPRPPPPRTAPSASTSVSRQEEPPSSATKFFKEELNFIKEPPEEVVIDCPICLQVMSESSSLTSCCGYHFCSPCISGVHPCPRCRATDYHTMLDKNRLRIIRGLKVKCCNDHCKWEGELKDLSDHIMRGRRVGDCGFELVTCTHAGCDSMHKRNSIDKHESNNCELRPYECPYCSQKGTYKQVTTEHYKICEYYPVECPNQCNLVLYRKNVETHLQTECPYEPVACELHWAGCSEMPLRQNVKKHVSEKIREHYTMLEAASKSTIEKLKDENKEMARQLDETTVKSMVEIEELKAKCKTLEINKSKFQELKTKCNTLEMEKCGLQEEIKLLKKSSKKTRLFSKT